MRRKVIKTVIVVFAMTACALAEETPITFESHIRPILKAKCFQCHGEDGKREGQLDLRLRRFVVEGGESGPAVVAGAPDKSHLLERIKLGEMPPVDDARKKVSADEISLIERWIAEGAVTARVEPEQLGNEIIITEEDRRHWAYQPITRPDVPRAIGEDRIRTAVDAFVLARLEQQGHSFSPDADLRTLMRRAYFDLIGLPPTPEEVAEFLADESPNAYERLIARLLASPHYGERWGRHWLDVAGYSDSEGAAGDDVRRFAYRYRDYVIRSFNADKPFDEFIRQQLAGDEMVGPLSGTPSPEQAEKLIATGFLQMAPDATASNGDRAIAHDLLVADTIKIVSSSLLGITVGCARCHDHRYDPISQDDYYRFRAIFEPALHFTNWQSRNRLIEYFTDEDRAHAEFLNEQQQRAVILRVAEQQLAKLPADKRPAARLAFDTPESERTPQQQQLLIDSKLNITADNIGEFDRISVQELQRLRPMFANRLKGSLQTIKENGIVPKTLLFVRGDPKQPKHEVEPQELTILCTESEAAIPVNDTSLRSTGRRLAYARQLTDGTHPLLARVIVNRIWMHYFGRGLCATLTDFGLQGEKPSHPELLDWLADEFMNNGWSLKKLHAQIMTSSVYRQGAQRSESLEATDPENRLLGAFHVRRLEAEIVRDAILTVSGTLNRKPFGMAVPVTHVPAGEIVIGLENTNVGIPLAVMPMFGEQWRRSIYVQARRSMPLTFMQMFDAPVMEPNCEARYASTVAPQSLVLMNSPFMLEQSLRFAERVREEAGSDLNEQIAWAWSLAFSRAPQSEELADAADFVRERTSYFRAHPPEPPKRVVVPGRNSMMMGQQRQDVLTEQISQTDPELLALALLCQMLMSSNEFLYVG